MRTRMRERRVPDPVDLVGRRLRGPAALRRDLLAELRDGFDDDVAARRDAGLDPAAAHAAAVVAFGDPDVVRAACQTELTAATARRTAVVLAVSLPAVDALWTWWYPGLARAAGARPELGDYAWLPLVQAIVAWLAAAVALHQLVLLGRGRGAAASGVVGVIAGVVVLVIGGTSALMLAADGGATLRALTASGRGVLLGALSAAMLGVVAMLAWRTTRLARLARPERLARPAGLARSAATERA